MEESKRNPELEPAGFDKSAEIASDSAGNLSSSIGKKTRINSKNDGKGSPQKGGKGNEKNFKKSEVNPEIPDIDEYSLGGFKYKLPDKKQRVVVASIVLGLNLLLIVAVGLYFTNLDFQHFIINVGR